MNKEELIKLFKDEHKCLNAFLYGDETNGATPAFTYWLIERDAKKNAEVERLKSTNADHVARINAWKNRDVELQSLKAKMAKAQKVWVESYDLGQADMQMFMCYESEEFAKADDCMNPIEVLLIEGDEYE